MIIIIRWIISRRMKMELADILKIYRRDHGEESGIPLPKDQ
jgi:hypothetical protein